MTRLRSVGGKNTTRDSEYPDDEFIAGVLREHPELVPKPGRRLPGWVTWRNALALSLGIVMAFLAVAVSSLWAPSGTAPADPPKQQNQPNGTVRRTQTPRHPSPGSLTANRRGGVVIGGRSAGAGGATPPASSGRLIGSPTITPPAAPVPRVINNGGQLSQQTAGATPAPAATPSPLLDSVPTPTCARLLPNGVCKPLTKGVASSPSPSLTLTPTPSVGDGWNPSLPIGPPPPSPAAAVADPSPITSPSP